MTIYTPTLDWIENALTTVHYSPCGGTTVTKGTNAGFCTNCGYDIQVLKDPHAKNVTCELCNQPKVFGVARFLCINDGQPLEE